MVIPPQSDRTQEDKTCVDSLCFAKARQEKANQNGAKLSMVVDDSEWKASSETIERMYYTN